MASPVDDAYLESCAGIFRRAGERDLERRRRRRIVLRVVAAALLVALIPATTALAVQGRRDSVATIELLDADDPMGRALVQVEAGADPERVMADLRSGLEALGWDIDVRGLRSPERFVGMVWAEEMERLDDPPLPAPFNRRMTITAHEVQLLVATATRPDEVFEVLGPPDPEICDLVGGAAAVAADAFDALGLEPVWRDRVGASEPSPDAVVVQVSQVGPQRVIVIADDSLEPVPCRGDYAIS